MKGLARAVLWGITLSLSMFDPGAEEGESCVYQYHVQCVRGEINGARPIDSSGVT